MGLVPDDGDSAEEWCRKKCAKDGYAPKYGVPIRLPNGNEIQLCNCDQECPLDKDAWKNTPSDIRKRVRNFMNNGSNGEEGAKRLLEEIKKNGVPEIDSDLRKGLEAYRDTIRAAIPNKAESTINSGVVNTRLEILNTILNK